MTAAPENLLARVAAALEAYEEAGTHAGDHFLLAARTLLPELAEEVRRLRAQREIAKRLGELLNAIAPWIGVVAGEYPDGGFLLSDRPVRALDVSMGDVVDMRALESDAHAALAEWDTALASLSAATDGEKGQE